ncbi:MAG: hypothetical protein ACRDOK_10000 [Streptosporangiaceae bacterium]
MTAHPNANPAAGSSLTGQPPGVRRACQCHLCAERAARRSNAGEELDAYIADLIERAPPLTGEQRDKLVLLLHDHRRSRVTGIEAPAA